MDRVRCYLPHLNHKAEIPGKGEGMGEKTAPDTADLSDKNVGTQATTCQP